MPDNKKPVEDVLEETLKNMKQIIDVDCIVGEIITRGEISLIPISKVSVGFVSGGGEYETNKKLKKLPSFLPFAGGAGGGCNITPVGFIVLSNNDVRFLKVDSENNIEKLIDVADKFFNNFK